ncbi:hypothetical protein Y1Q_0015616 [Alligator mississippiensis]|uniref:Uncharacterized protein n=1 Tax=Alligator mississippiensis TaxID=8496 RepID=A0A151NNS3_ALLMI|nr:hypothetical protein Y1Q_0015616 [Alligator mississippiensis]
MCQETVPARSISTDANKNFLVDDLPKLALAASSGKLKNSNTRSFSVCRADDKATWTRSTEGLRCSEEE